MYVIPVFGVLALLYTFWKSGWVSKQDVGTDKMAKIAKHISDGAMSFLKAEYKVLAIFVAVVAVLLAFTAQAETSSWLVAVSFILGAICSALAGFIGMKVATKANVRTTAAARTSLGRALEVAFAGGAVMGLGVVGLGVLGLGVLFLVYSGMFVPDAVQGVAARIAITKVITVLTGFSFGASSIALFARVGGGIYTKAADVGADLVGKVEAGIPEDHPLNPATIADNVGDNVGDVAGMGADLTGGFDTANQFGGMNAVLLPLVLASVGILTSIIGTFFVKVKEGGDPQKALNIGEFFSAGLMLAATWAIAQWMLPNGLGGYTANGVFFAVLCYFRSALLCWSLWYRYCGGRDVVQYRYPIGSRCLWTDC